MYSASRLHVSLGNRPVLRDIALSLKPGRVTAIAGPNGSGKSTLLRTLAGELPHDGELMLSGRPLARLQPQELASMRGVLPQSTEVAFSFTVGEVVRLGLLAGRRGAGDNGAERIERALARVGLAGFAGRDCQELSGGEQQRVQLARVLCQIPDPVLPDGTACWLLLDEPVSSLDIRHQLEIMGLARDFARAGGGVIAVMHDLNLTALFANDLLLVRDGRIAASGPVAEVMTDAILEKVYSCRLRVNAVPAGSVPFVLAHSAVT